MAIFGVYYYVVVAIVDRFMIEVRMIRYFILLFCFLVNAFVVFTQTRPSWCENVVYDKSYLANENLRTEGISYLLSDVQVNFVTQEYYTHLSMKIVGVNGLRQASSLMVNYDSTFQTAQFLSVHIIRNGQVVDVLKKQQPQQIRREKNLEYGMVDGSLTSYLKINDLRVGDILDYSCVVKGFNPIVRDFMAISQNTCFSVPIGKVHVCFVTGVSDDYNYQLKNGAPRPLVKECGNTTKYIWEVSNPEVINIEQDIPLWYDPVPKVLFSSNTNWERLTNHVLSLFTSEEALGYEYQALLDTIKGHYASKEEQARYAIKFVQNNIHYFANENGIYSFKPRHPNVILHKKSGDCKEKSWLLACLLKDIGYEAYPVLVNTSRGHVLEDQPVSLSVFDHCVNCLITGQDTIYIDPTITNQGGRLHNLFFPNYEKGLVVKIGASGLTSLPVQKMGKTTIEESYSFEGFRGLAYLHVKTVHEGGNADFQRTLFKNVALKDIQTGCLNLYADTYLRIDTLCMLSFEDDPEMNVTTLTQSYVIKNFWDVTDTLQPNNLMAKFHAKAIHDLLLRETYPSRKSPMALVYPIDITHIINVELPEDWIINNESETIAGEGFAFTRRVNYDDRNLTLSYNYVTTQSYVDKDNYLDFIEKNGRVFNNLNYVLWYYGSKNMEGQKDMPHPFFLALVIMTLLVYSMIAFKAYKYDPKVAPKYQGRNQPIGGWLLVPAIGIVAWTFTMCVLFIMKIDGGINNWLLPDASEDSSLRLLGRLILLFGLLLLLVFGVLNSVLLFLRRSSFPRMMVIYYIAFSIFSLMVSIIMHVALQDGEVFFMNLLPFANSAVWIPYFIKSERVKRTFTKRLSPERILAGEEIVTV